MAKLMHGQDCVHSCSVNTCKVRTGLFVQQYVLSHMHVWVCMYNILGLESLVGRHLRRFPAAGLQNPSPQSLSSALISSYRHGACGRRLPGFQTLSSATVTAAWWRSEERAERDLLANFVQNWSAPKIWFPAFQGSAHCVGDWSRLFWLATESQIFNRKLCFHGKVTDEFYKGTTLKYNMQL